MAQTLANNAALRTPCSKFAGKQWRIGRQGRQLHLRRDHRGQCGIITPGEIRAPRASRATGTVAERSYRDDRATRNRADEQRTQRPGVSRSGSSTARLPAHRRRPPGGGAECSGHRSSGRHRSRHRGRTAHIAGPRGPGLSGRPWCRRRCRGKPVRLENRTSPSDRRPALSPRVFGCREYVPPSKVSSTRTGPESSGPRTSGSSPPARPAVPAGPPVGIQSVYPGSASWRRRWCRHHRRTWWRWWWYRRRER